jgi:hypothetical protein
MGQTDKKYIRRLERVLLIRVTLPPLDKYNIFPTSQAMLHLNHDTIPDRLSLVTRPKRHTKVLQGQRGSPTAQDDSQLSSIIHVANKDQEGFGQINL